MAPILGPRALDIISHSVDQTRRLGARLGRLLISGDVICLEGELGTGKTCLAQGIGRGLGIGEPIISPTFTLIREYKTPQGRPPFYHIDFFRLEDAEEALALGLEEYFYGDGVCVIEWAEKMKAVLPPERLWITLRHLDETKRGLLMEATGQRYEELLREFRRVAFGV
ncbi:MAG TPA: tRNA (adenosine(37)-N6)-threonylcarbamoyltransferase complex ATPase subunit type 1 TsaE [Anaerolineae bacterium]|nr:tRNA (adenosine(37)-N6)-threonylcarbamoyltransferase complex ATPase subunit type 1 TsaE [Anaerolineae bacterium]